MVNSTITGNTAAEGASSIAAEGDLTLVYSDVVGNTMNPSLEPAHVQRRDERRARPIRTGLRTQPHRG